MNAGFLSGSDLSDALRRVAGANNLRCAVAFWGNGAGAFLEDAGADLGAVQIVCDVGMGGTSADELIRLGAPKNRQLRHMPGLHAKVYLSDQGAIVGSANASDNGIGFGPAGARHIEAGTYHGPHTSGWRAAAAWFERLYEGAHQVDKAAIATARARFSNPDRYATPRLRRPGSLLDMVALSPELFDGVGFVLASALSSEADQFSARKKAERAGIASKEELDAMPGEGMFTNWSKSDVLRWPVSFIELWIPKRSLRYYPQSVRMLHPGAGTVFSKPAGQAVRQMLPRNAPSFVEAQRLDAELAIKLRENDGGLYPTARHLAETLAKL